MLGAERTRLSVQEYLDREASAEVKSEYVHGELFAMTGASIPHNLVTANVITAFNNALDGKDCSVFASDTKIEIELGAHYVYPDVSVVCGDVLYGQDRNDVLANPMVVVEVLSKSTRDYDRGSKFKAYRRIGSMTDYLLVDQYAIAVEHFHRERRGFWTMAELEGEEARVKLETLEVELVLADFYRGLGRVQPS